MESETKSHVDQIKSPSGYPVAILRFEGDIASTSKDAVLGAYEGLPRETTKLILLDFTRHRMMTDGVDLETGIRSAAQVRLRPILMTTLCTLFGLLPLALGIGAGSELQKPLALAVIGGLALSTPVTLFVVPVLLVAIRGRGHRLA